VVGKHISSSWMIGHFSKYVPLDMYLYLVLKLLARQAIGRASREREPCTIDKRLQVAATSSST